MITDIYHKHKGVFFFYLDIMKYQKYSSDRNFQLESKIFLAKMFNWKIYFRHTENVEILKMIYSLILDFGRLRGSKYGRDFCLLWLEDVCNHFTLFSNEY